MKLATLYDGTRDGALVVVSRDLSRHVPAGAAAPTLQAALDRWDDVAPLLRDVYDKLNADGAMGAPFDAEQAASPLPRAYEWIDGSAYINHVVLVRKARNAEPPATLRTDPLVYQGGSGVFLRPRGEIVHKEEHGIDFESEVCVILGDTPRGTKAASAQSAVRLVCICNDVSLRNLIPDELAKGFGFFTSKPATAFSPVAVTPDELGGAWQGGRVHLPLVTKYNGAVFGSPDAGPEMFFSFYDLIEHVTKTRSLTAGTILGSGTVSNEDTAKGSSCLAEKRMLEKINSGAISTPFMKHGDTVEIEMFDAAGASIFGRIAHRVNTHDAV